METKDLDVVYCVKTTNEDEELRYSLRSLKNMPHNKVWIYGGDLDWLDNVERVPIKQDKGNKWLNTAYLLKQICLNDNITEDFIWFNDDFYILQQIDKLQYYKDRTLSQRTVDFSKRGWWGPNNAYCTRLKCAERSLKFKGRTYFNFELHIPMIFNRKKLLQVIKEFPYDGAKRSLYGNTFVKDAIQRDDVKIYTRDEVPEDDWDFLSTSDDSFREGEVGKYIRKIFSEECQYEKNENKRLKLRKGGKNGQWARRNKKA